MLGGALLVAPALTEGATTVDAYLPPGLWYSLAQNTTVDTRTAARWGPGGVHSNFKLFWD